MNRSSRRRLSAYPRTARWDRHVRSVNITRYFFLLNYFTNRRDYVSARLHQSRDTPVTGNDDNSRASFDISFFISSFLHEISVTATNIIWLAQLPRKNIWPPHLLSAQNHSPECEILWIPPVCFVLLPSCFFNDNPTHLFLYVKHLFFFKTLHFLSINRRLESSSCTLYLKSCSSTLFISGH